MTRHGMTHACTHRIAHTAQELHRGGVELVEAFTLQLQLTPLTLNRKYLNGAEGIIRSHASYGNGAAASEFRSPIRSRE